MQNCIRQQMNLMKHCLATIAQCQIDD